jgi:hypothetical protein
MAEFLGTTDKNPLISDPYGTNLDIFAGFAQMERWHDPSSKQFEIIGIPDVMAKLNRYISDVPNLVLGEMEIWAEKILSESKQEVPWDTTHLLQTGTVEPFEEGGMVGYQIGYNAISSREPGFFSGKWNNFSTIDYNYGIRQHEDLTLHHPKPGTKAKYLEDPFNRIKGDVLPGIVRTMDWYFSAGVPSMSGMMASKRALLGNLGGRFV